MTKPLGDPTDHFWRMQRMARVTGTDLVSAYATPDLSADDFAAMLTACRGCSDPNGCDRMLSSDAKTAPSFCENASKMEQLRAVGHRRQDR